MGMYMPPDILVCGRTVHRGGKAGEKAQAREKGIGSGQGRQREGVYQGCIYVSGPVVQERGHRGMV